MLVVIKEVSLSLTQLMSLLLYFLFPCSTVLMRMRVDRADLVCTWSPAKFSSHHLYKILNYSKLAQADFQRNSKDISYQ